MPSFSFDPTRRPLSAGELLDRTITVLVRRALPFLAMVAVVAVPVTIAQLLIPNGISEVLNAIAKSSSQPPGPATNQAILRAVQTAHISGWLVLEYAIVAITMPLAGASVMFAASQAYDGQAASLRDALASGVRRWFPAVGVVLSWILGGSVATVAAVFAIVFGGTAAFFAFRAVNMNLAVGLAIAVSVIAFIVVAFAAVVLTMVYMLSFAAAVLETANPFVAIGRAFTRVFTRTEFWRSALLALALIFVSLALSVAGLIAGGAAYSISHADAGLIIFSQLASLLAFAFQFVFGAMYYRDVRLRREGTDLLEIVDAPL